MQKSITKLQTALAFLALLSAPVVAQNDRQPSSLPNMFSSANNHGRDATFSTVGRIDLGNPFFKSLGSNGRSCASCHAPSQGWTITPKGVQKLFKETQGLDPLFRLVDGANSPIADVSTVEKRRLAYSMLLRKANIRVGIGIPANAEFELIEVDDPYGFASETELSLFRRPMPTTNLKFLSTVMWDGRETTLMPGSKDCIYGTSTCFAPVSYDLGTQANHATLGHAEALHELTDEERDAIVKFESGLFTAQIYDNKAGNLASKKTLAGPKKLYKQNYYFGINDPLVGDYQTQQPFNAHTMSLYDNWNRSESGKSSTRTKKAKAAIARGQALFNTKPIKIRNVKGINDDLGVSVLAGTCTTCHNTPNSGNHSIPMPLDIGIADESRRTSDMPLYTLKNKTTHEIIKTTDPGRALITGQWKDIGRFKGPILRGVASRPPYFHDGSAANLPDVVEFYNDRFNMKLTSREKADLVAFLAAL
jgi:cytochrome c peroxidase